MNNWMKHWIKIFFIWNIEWDKLGVTLEIKTILTIENLFEGTSLNKVQ